MQDDTNDSLSSELSETTPAEQPADQAIEGLSERLEDGTGQQDTGETPEIQAEPATEDASSLQSPQNIRDPGAKDPKASKQEEGKQITWRDHLIRYHNDMNGLLAAKENLKIVAVHVSARPSFYKKWSFEANQCMRITAILRRRLAWSEKK